MKTKKVDFNVVAADAEKSSMGINANRHLDYSQTKLAERRSIFGNLPGRKVFAVVTVWLILLILSVIVDSCIRCPKTFSYQYSLSSFEIHPIGNEEIMSLMGNGRSGADENPLVFRKDFGVQIEFKADINMLANRVRVNSFFIQSAYAWSCEHDRFYPKNSIVSIKVFSNKDFSEIYPAGSNVAEFFQIREWSGNVNEYGPFPWLTSFEDYFQRPAPEFWAFFDYKINCLITAINIEAGEYEFRFVVGLSDERVLEQTIKAVLLAE